MIQKAKKIAGALIIGTIFLTSCGKKEDASENQQFTKIDSLTESYLSYNDSILQAWNVMINDDNQKIKSMRLLISTLLETNTFNQEELILLNDRINQLFESRYTPESLNEESIEEYDFASNALITEVTTLARAFPESDEDGEIQKMLAEILAADQRLEKYRNDYDQVVERYNQFLIINKPTIEEDPNLDWKKKAKFGN